MDNDGVPLSACVVLSFCLSLLLSSISSLLLCVVVVGGRGDDVDGVSDVGDDEFDETDEIEETEERGSASLLFLSVTQSKIQTHVHSTHHHNVDR